MGRFADVKFVSGPRICRRGDYVLFRPRRETDQMGWRREHLPDRPIPAFLYPERAKAAVFRSMRSAGQEMRRQWGACSDDLSEPVFSPFLDVLSSIYRYRPARERGYGVHGLYTVKHGRRILQSVHALVPFIDPQTENPIPLMAACAKAPWNRKGLSEVSTLEEWRAQYWGIDLAVLIHAIRTFYKSEEYSFGEQVISGWRMGLLLPFPATGYDPHIQFQDLLNYLSKLDSPELRTDSRIFGVELEKIDVSGLGVFPNHGREWLAYGFRTDGETAENLVQTYCKWMDIIFRELSFFDPSRN